MQRFAELLDLLSYTQSRNRKVALLAAYFRDAPGPDRGWALAALTDGLPLRLPLRRALSDLMADHVDPVLYRLSRDYVGDTAETVALLWPDRADGVEPPSLNDIMTAVREAPRAAFAPILASLLDRLDARGRWALLKLLGGAPRVGVSARLAKTAVAAAFGRDVADIEEAWHAVQPPYGALFAWLEGEGGRPDTEAIPVFRPIMLAHPIEEADKAALDPAAYAAEWKWDGIRVQVAAKSGEARVFSRAGDDISRAFPEIAEAFAGRDVAADGELLVLRDGAVAPFNDLQQRLNRKAVTGKMLARYPAHVRLYDLLLAGGEDLRARPFTERRAALEAWHGAAPPPLTSLSDLVPFETLADLDTLWTAARQHGIEGLMLKRKASPYLAGRVKGHWWKWKRAALTLDCVLMYAQRGSGKRSSFYSDYTFGVWRDIEKVSDPAGLTPGAHTVNGVRPGGSDPKAARELVPVGKAYSGFTDAELKDLDRWIRNHATERFGPVRAVEPGLVLEIAFDALHRSTRHKSGVAMRFPRVHRIRWDKPAGEADTMERVWGLLEGKS